MEPEGSLPHSQVPATCPFPGPYQSSPCLHIPLPEIHHNIILPSTSESSKRFFPSGFPTKTLYTPRLSPHTCYMPRLSHYSRLRLMFTVNNNHDNV